MKIMHIIVGLGNPGEEYKNTRHNVGWSVLTKIIENNSLPALVKSSAYSGFISEGMLFGAPVGILLPTTYMNNSGTAAVKYIDDKGTILNLIVVHDEVDLPFGTIRIVYDRGAGGHNGVRSMIDALHETKFIRIRIGIAQQGFFGGIKRPKGEKLSKFVLGEFKKGEEKQLGSVTEKVEAALKLIIEKGCQVAMQEVNKDS